MASLWLVPGLLMPLLFPALPGGALILAFLFCCAILAYVSRKPAFLLFALGSLWTLLHLQGRLDSRLDPADGEVLLVNGWVSSLPVERGDLLEFQFKTRQADGIDGGFVSVILVRWYRDAPGIRAGEHWQLSLNLKPARSRVNFNGPDREKWYFSQGIAALGVVDSGNSRRMQPARQELLLSWRHDIRDSIEDILDGHPSQSLLLGLSLADRSRIDAQQWQRFRVTGTSHLLAISGMHVGLAAATGFWLGRLLNLLLPLGFTLRFGIRMPWCFSISMAGVYALMAGMGTSTRRALIMLVTFAVIYLCRRSTGPWSCLSAALVAILLLDPAAPLTAGFWFSFSAVAVLIAMFNPRSGRRHWLSSLLLAQAGLAMVMTPMGMFWFQQFTLLGLLSNLLAIPWVSFAVVPATLFSVLLLPTDSWLSPFLMFSAAESLAWLSSLLAWLEEHGRPAWYLTASPGLVSMVLASAGACLLLLPRGMSFRLLGLLLVYPLLNPGKQEPHSLRLELLDVGQGLAALVETENHLLLYDAGPGDGVSWSLVPSSIAPAINQARRRHPDRIVISHGDLDHAGGLHELQARYRNAEFFASLGVPRAGIKKCMVPLHWAWDGVSFKVLHPNEGLPYLGNNSSCVLSVVLGDQRILMTGDIGLAVERRLAASGLAHHQLLLAPHHGSKSSSGYELIRSVNPEFSLVSAGFRNRFGFPHPSVSDRYTAHGVGVWSTSDCGALEFRYRRGQKPRIRSARRQRAALWRWKPEAYCP